MADALGTLRLQGSSCRFSLGSPRYLRQCCAPPRRCLRRGRCCWRWYSEEDSSRVHGGGDCQARQEASDQSLPHLLHKPFLVCLSTDTYASPPFTCNATTLTWRLTQICKNTLSFRRQVRTTKRHEGLAPARKTQDSAAQHWQLASFVHGVSTGDIPRTPQYNLVQDSRCWMRPATRLPV